MKPSDISYKLLCGALVVFVAGCSSFSSSDSKKTAGKAKSGDTQVAALEGVDSQDVEAAANQPEQLSNVIRRNGTVANRGGYIKILVNKEPITNFEIQRRMQFLKLRRVGGNRRQKAEQEMIEQALQLSEAKRLRTYASDQQVDEAYARFARSNRATPAQLSQQLGQLGVGTSHFKEYIRNQMSWGRSLQRYYDAKNSQQALERDVVTGLRKSGGAKPELTEYTFKRVVFIVPKSKRSAGTVASRKREAQAFRQRFPGCDQAVEAVKSLRDVTVVNERRMLEPEIPDRWKERVQKASGSTTTAIETPNGVEFLAICSKRQVNDDRAAVVAKQAENFTDLNTQQTKLEKEYLDQLRRAATIVYQ